MGYRFFKLDDNNLMELYQNGDEKAFDVLYSRSKKRVYSYLKKRLHDKDLVEDVYQNIFIKLHKSRHLYKSEYPYRNWLYKFAEVF